MNKELKKFLLGEIEKINKEIADDEKRCGGYEMIRYFHETAPEDYNEMRTTWADLCSYADDMYYMLARIETIINNIKGEIEDDFDD